nr:hypothetical protein [Tanacetum cinerariifolium]
MNTASSSGSGTLPSNTITNSKEDLKANGAWSFWGGVVEVVEIAGNLEEWQESGKKWGCGELAGKMVKDEH